MAERPDTILVLGMHRSGTSALTRTLALCGAALPRTLFPPTDGDNETGYWESTPIIEFHQRLLWKLDTGFLDPRCPRPTWFQSADAKIAADELAAIIESEWSSAAPWVMKDPRMCRLVPLWRTALAKLGRVPFALHCLREPSEVAASLARRNGFSRPTAELLWAQHVALAERDTRDMPRNFIQYHSLLNDWRTTLVRIATQIPGLDLESRRDEINQFLDPTRRRQRDDGHNANSEVVTRLRRTMFASCNGSEPDCCVVDDVLQSITRRFV